MRFACSSLILVSLVTLAGGGCGSVPATPDGAPGVDAAPDGPVAPTDEQCTESTAGSSPRDEDQDGKVDEGCAWHFGPQHWLAPIVAVNAWETNVVEPTAVSRDGKRLYLVHGLGANAITTHRILMATRADRSQPFGAPAAVTGTELANYNVFGLALSEDEREGFVVAAPTGGPTDLDLYRMVRPSTTEPFGALERLAALSTDKPEERPALRADGLELVWASNQVMRHALRPSTSTPFGAPEDLHGIQSEKVNGATLSNDGLTLFYYAVAPNGRFRLYQATRTDPDSATFDTPVEITDLDPTGQLEAFLPVLSESTRELFFASSQPWSPTYYAIWRAEICRDGACSSTPVPCAGVRSPDAMHCYTRLDAAQSHAAAETACASAGGHLASINSQAEHDLLWSMLGNENIWIGAFDDARGVSECNARSAHGSVAWPCAWGWTSGEPWTYANWATTPTYGAEPNEYNDTSEECGLLWTGETAGHWADTSCASVYRGICETVKYPTW